MARKWTKATAGACPSDSPKAIRPHASATSAARQFISEIPLIALPVRSAAWKARNPANVPSTASTAQLESKADAPSVAQLTEIALIAASAVP